ncbi:MAG TPA: methyltransferase domain-containing protein, partial [Phycisphaerales bacterium]|nr:methyltransferase domain-containing protein [Phycisphaerales bacterium]
PAGTLAEALRVLAPGGRLLAVTPCLSHIKARLAGRRWKYFTPPWHLHFFTTRSLRTLLSRIGFEVLACSCLNHRAHVRVLARKPSNAGS